MRTLWFAAILAVVLTSGCMISEQIGEGNQELTFHFDTQFNRVVLFGRSAAIALVGIWLLAGSRKKAGPVAFGLVFLVAALVTFGRDYPTLKGYSVGVLDDGLHVSIPPSLDRVVPWRSIEEMYIEGVGPVGNRRGDAISRMLELPDWHTMDVTVAGGDKFQVNLELLSVEQRQILWKAIARRAGLVEIEE